MATVMVAATLDGTDDEDDDDDYDVDCRLASPSRAA